MNKYQIETRKRGRTLLIVEGNHERNKLFWLIFRCFPEIEINMDDVWIYGTNIYLLYDDIVKEYGDDWAEMNDDIDLPYVISKKKHSDSLQYKENFKNIILVFDYERHDPKFSAEKILDMQRYFTDAADMGKLYINYPMIESYQHLRQLPDSDYEERKVPVSLQPGKKYKALIASDTVINSMVEFPHKIDNLFEVYLGVADIQKRDNCVNSILNISEENVIAETIQLALQEVIEEARVKTIKYQLVDWVTKQAYVHKSQTYWEYMRYILRQIIKHNICKANKIQYSQYHIEEEKYKDCFARLDLSEILAIQNIASSDEETGYIWVLSTCIFFVAEYNFALVNDMHFC